MLRTVHDLRRTELWLRYPLRPVQLAAQVETLRRSLIVNVAETTVLFVWDVFWAAIAWRPPHQLGLTILFGGCAAAQLAILISNWRMLIEAWGMEAWLVGHFRWIDSLAREGWLHLAE